MNKTFRLVTMMFVAAGIFAVATSSYAAPKPNQTPFPKWPTLTK